MNELPALPDSGRSPLNIPQICPRARGRAAGPAPGRGRRPIEVGTRLLRVWGFAAPNHM